MDFGRRLEPPPLDAPPAPHDSRTRLPAGEGLPAVAGHPVFYPQWLSPAEDRIARNGRIVRKSSLRNLARMRPCRSPREKFVLEQLAWQWWVSREPGAKWGVRRTGKLLGVSGQAIYQLARKFRAQPDAWRRRFAPFPWATLAHLREAREETRLWRQRGWLRNPIRSRRVSYLWEGKRRKQAIFTSAELRRRALAAASDPRLSPRQQLLAARRLRAKWRRYPPCPLAIQHYWRKAGSCRCGLARADFPPPSKRAPRPAPSPVLRAGGDLYIGCSPVTRDALGRWMGRNGHPFDPALLSHDQLPLWARGLAFQLPPPPPRSGASTLFAPAPPPPLKPIHFARHRRPRP